MKRTFCAHLQLPVSPAPQKTRLLPATLPRTMITPVFVLQGDLSKQLVKMTLMISLLNGWLFQEMPRRSPIRGKRCFWTRCTRYHCAKTVRRTTPSSVRIPSQTQWLLLCNQLLTTYLASGTPLTKTKPSKRLTLRSGFKRSINDD